MNIPVLSKLNENKEFFYALALILLIPSAFVANTYFFVQRLNNDFNTELTAKANLATNVLASTLKETATNSAKLKAQVEKVATNSADIKGLTVLSFEKGSPAALATSEGEEALSNETVLLSKLAWTTGQPYTTKHEALNEKGETIRLWQVSLPMREGDKNLAVINLKVSGEKSDALINRLEKDSLIFTVAALFVVVLLLLNHFRFFGYARLFQKLKEVDEMKDNFISLASHELRTPVTALQGFAQLALRKLKSGRLQEATEDLDKVNKSAEGIAALVNDLLDVSRIEQRRLKLKIARVDLTQVVSLVTSELKVQADQKGLALKYLKPPSGLFIEADPQKLKQIFVNLIGNAIKYTQKGEVAISHEVESGQIKTFIADTGLGIPAEEMPHLFEKFHRIQTKETSQIRGTGLGLWITKQLVEMMKGKIFVESIENTGTKVIVTFPQAKQPGT
jgi:K+-sensing histidine kinase KdpD